MYCIIDIKDLKLKAIHNYDMDIHVRIVDIKDLKLKAIHN